MALINCSECGKQISDKATSCPSCGAPVDQNNLNSFNQQPVGHQNVLPSQKKKGGCLKVFLIFFAFFVVIMMLAIKNSDSSEPSKTTKTESHEESKKSLLDLDEKSWKQFKGLYISHNNFMKTIDSFSNNQITSLDFYNECKKAKKYFMEVSTTFDYGSTDNEKTYLDVFEVAALKDQQAVEYLMKYIDTGKTSHLSKAQEYIQAAKDAFIIIAENRGKLLVKAGLTDEEIKTKIENDMDSLVEEMNK